MFKYIVRAGRDVERSFNSAHIYDAMKLLASHGNSCRIQITPTTPLPHSLQSNRWSERINEPNPDEVQALLDNAGMKEV